MNVSLRVLGPFLFSYTLPSIRFQIVKEKKQPSGGVFLLMQLKIDGLFKKKVTVDFSQENTSSDGGLLLIKTMMDRFEMAERIKGIVGDDRHPSYIDHSMESLLAQRLYQLCAGYEDLNDSQALRKDPLLKLVVNESPQSETDLASASTLGRLENEVGILGIHGLCELQVELYLERNRKRWKKAAKHKNLVIRLDMDPTDIETYGEQQLALFHGYYGHRCYLPMVIADGDNGDLITAFLRPGTKHAKFLLVPILKRLLARIEKEYPFVQFEVRADSGFQCDEVFQFLESKSNISYTLSLASNKILERLQSEAVAHLETARKEAEDQKTSFETQRIFGELGYRAESWSRHRRVVFQIEANSHRVEIRYLVTNQIEWPAQQVKEHYNQRANIENRIKELKTQSFGSRMSCETFEANSFRFQLACFSLILFQEIKKKLENTPLKNAYVETIRSKLLKVSVIVSESTRRFILLLPKSYPYPEIWRDLLAPA